MSLNSPEYLALAAEIAKAEADVAQLGAALKKIAADASAGTALTAAGFLPPPAGTAADLISLGKDLGAGDWGGAFWSAVGIFPIIGDAAKVAGKGARVANKMSDLQKTLDKARDVIKQKQDELAKLCKDKQVKTKDNVTGKAENCGKGDCGKPDPVKTAKIKAKMDDLKRQGHGPQRHEGDVTEDQLKDRAMYGKDPMTGTTTDGVTGEAHKYSKNATKINSEEDYVLGESHLRNSDEFKTKAADAELTGKNRIVIENQKLENVYGNNYKEKVSGQTRIGSKNNPSGSMPTDFKDGSMVGVYTKSQSTGKWELTTMYPEPKI